MKLDDESLTDTPLFAKLLAESTIAMSGARELLSDEYQPPKPPVLNIAYPPQEVDTEEFEFEGYHSDVPLIKADLEVSQGYPDMVAVKSSGINLVRPVPLANMYRRR